MTKPNLSRRVFLGGAAALFLSPRRLWADGVPPQAGRWERPDGTATDPVMVRRLYLDLAGRIPTADEARSYVASEAPGKRAELADRLLASDDFANYWAMRFCDILRVKSEFPINLWPNAVYVYHRRIRAFVADDEPWDRFGTDLLTSQGSDFRDAGVNFFRATVKRTPEGWAEAVAQTFLGIPPDRLDPARRDRIAAHFAGVRIKDSREWKEEIVYADGPDRRGELCRRLFGDCRAEVADAFRRRVCEWIFGPGCRPVGAAGELRLKELLRSVVLSPAYAAGSVTGDFPARRLDAEVLDDALCALSGSPRDYQSPAPEPFSFLPPERPTVCIEDGSISSGFLTLFGRPARDTGLPGERRTEVTAKQRLTLFNSVRIHGQLGRIVTSPGGKGAKPPPFDRRVDDLYWKLLSRPPAADERRAIRAVWNARSARPKPNAWAMLRDVAWCLVNSKEFLFRT